MADEKKTYRVKPGFTFGAFDQYKAGSTLELTDAEAGGVMDKLELADGSQSDVSAVDQVQAPSLRAAIASATDEELLQIPGITKRDFTKLREWAGGAPVQNSAPQQTPALKVTSAAPAPTPTPAPAPDSVQVPADAVGSVTTETVNEEPLKTTETVQTTPADETPVEDTTAKK